MEFSSYEDIHFIEEYENEIYIQIWNLNAKIIFSNYKSVTIQLM